MVDNTKSEMTWSKRNSEFQVSITSLEIEQDAEYYQEFLIFFIQLLKFSRTSKNISWPDS